MSKIYVTGAAGMIGSVLCTELVKSGRDVVGIDNFWRGRMENISGLRKMENFEFRLNDLRFDDSWAADLGVQDVVIHIADIVAGIGYVFNNEFGVYRDNCRINSGVAAVVNQKCPKKVLYLGTACSYPQSMQRTVLESQLTESDKFPADPESGYGWSKLMGEIELKLAVKGNDTQLIVLDLHNVYGWPSAYSDARSQVIPSLIWRAITQDGQPLTVWGNGSQGRAFVHVSDVARAIMLGLDYEGEESVFMIGPDYCSTIKDVATIILEHPLIKTSEIVYDLTKPTGDIGRFADYSKAKKHLGWEPRLMLGEGINQLIEHIMADSIENK